MPTLVDLVPFVFLSRTWLIVLAVAVAALVGYCVYRASGRGRRKRRRR